MDFGALRNLYLRSLTEAADDEDEKKKKEDEKKKKSGSSTLDDEPDTSDPGEGLEDDKDDEAAPEEDAADDDTGDGEGEDDNGEDDGGEEGTGDEDNGMDDGDADDDGTGEDTGDGEGDDPFGEEGDDEAVTDVDGSGGEGDFDMDDPDAEGGEDGDNPDDLPGADDDGSNDVGAGEDGETNIQINILKLSKLDRALAKRTCYQYFMSLRSTIEASLGMIEKNDAVIEPTIRENTVQKLHRYAEQLDNYLKYKFPLVNYEEGLQHYFTFVKEINETLAYVKDNGIQGALKNKHDNKGSR